MINRRTFVKLVGVAAGLGLTGLSARGSSVYKARVVIVGGGYGGATAAKYLRLTDPQIEVMLIEKNQQYTSCPLSNEVLVGERPLESLIFKYDALEPHYGIKVIQDRVVQIEPVKKMVLTQGGQKMNYDRLIVSPGIGFRWGAIEGYDEAAAQDMPHAWFAGEQTLLLRRQLEALEDGGKVFIVAPPNPYKCPPGPYERASLMAHYLRQHGRSRCKIIILDAKDAFSKQALFLQGWEQHYPGMIEWRSSANDGTVKSVDPKTRTLRTEFEEYQGGVMNVIPPQKAGEIAEATGLADNTGWCPIDPMTFESKVHKDIHVIGDACTAGPMPKSAYSANSQAKVCVAAIVALINGNPPALPSYVNTCYSIIAPDHGISVAAVYRLVDGKIVSVEGAGGVSPLQASPWERKMEAVYARSWFDNITSDIFR